MFKNLFGFLKKSPREPKYKVGDLVYTHFPKEKFPALHMGMIVKSKHFEDFTEKEKEEHPLVVIIGKNNMIYTVLCGQKTILFPEYLLIKHHVE